MSKFFGTDGIRGKAEIFTRGFLEKIILGLEVKGKKVLIGGDTRESTERILRDLGEILGEAGAERVATVGVLSTPAINYVFYQLGFDFAIDVTASHNPYTDNGIKIFERGEEFGVKLGERKKEKVEEAIRASGSLSRLDSEESREVEDLSMKGREIYLEHLRSYLGKGDFSGLKIGLDFANGATGVISGEIFRERGAETVEINNKVEYGREINNDAGSTHIEGLQKLVRERGLDFGAAFDGDGDRVLFSDKNGEVVDGDQILAILAKYFKLDAIVATVMANRGLLNFGKEERIEIVTTDVGDQNVFAEMKKRGVKIGGEQSGHIILPEEAMGDGVLTALVITKIIKRSGKSLDELAGEMKKFPQVMINIEASSEDKEKLKSSAEIRKLIETYEKQLEEMTKGRILVRPSGTEELVRITIWGEKETKIREIGEEFAEKLKKELKNGN